MVCKMLKLLKGVVRQVVSCSGRRIPIYGTLNLSFQDTRSVLVVMGKSLGVNLPQIRMPREVLQDPLEDFFRYLIRSTLDCVAFLRSNANIVDVSGRSVNETNPTFFFQRGQKGQKKKIYYLLSSDRHII